MLLLAAMSAFPGMSIDMVLPALPGVAAEFGISNRDAQMTISAFLLGAAIGQLAIGPLSDRYGRRPIAIAGLGLYVLAAIGAVLTVSATSLVLFRFFQGAGVATGFVLSRAIVRDLFDNRNASRMLSNIMMAVSMAALAAPLVGATLVVAAEWRAVFGTLAAAGGVLLMFVAAYLPESLSRRDPDALRPRTIIGNYRRFFGTRISFGYAIVNACLYGGLLAYLSGSPFVMVSGVGQLPETAYGSFLAVTALALVAGAAVNGCLLKRFSPQAVIGAGMALLAALSVAMLASAWFAKGSVGMPAVMSLVLPMAVYSVALGLIAPNATAIGMKPVSEMAGSAASVMLSLQAIAGAATGYLVNLAHDGTPTSIAVVVAGCCFAAASIYWLALCGQADDGVSMQVNLPAVEAACAEDAPRQAKLAAAA